MNKCIADQRMLNTETAVQGNSLFLYIKLN